MKIEQIVTLCTIYAHSTGDNAHFGPPWNWRAVWAHIIVFRETAMTQNGTYMTIQQCTITWLPRYHMPVNSMQYESRKLEI